MTPSPKGTITHQIENSCITFAQCRTNVEDVWPALLKCYINVSGLLGRSQFLPYLRRGIILLFKGDNDTILMAMTKCIFRSPYSVHVGAMLDPQQYQYRHCGGCATMTDQIFVWKWGNGVHNILPRNVAIFGPLHIIIHSTNTCANSFFLLIICSNLHKWNTRVILQRSNVNSELNQRFSYG